MSYGSETNGIGAYGAESSSGGGGQPEVCPIGETWDSWDLNPREGGDTYNLDYSTLLFDGASISISTEMRSFLFNGNTGIGGTPIHALFGTQQCALWLDSKSNNTASLIVKYGSGISQTPFRTEYSKVNLIDAEVDFSGVVSDGALVLTGSITAKLYVGGVLLDTISTSGSFTRSSAVIRVLSILTTMPDVFNGTIVGQGFPNQCKAVHQYLGNYDVTLNLSMQIRDNWNGNNTIFDYGSTADTYTFDGDLVTTDYDIWERLNGNSA
ncbi:MAG: hypothetical protein GY938_05540, partial [Ketobacter sp.]|nr:hypothetical protein [Ketobacter sp.]